MSAHRMMMARTEAAMMTARRTVRRTDVFRCTSDSMALGHVRRGRYTGNLPGVLQNGERKSEKGQPGVAASVSGKERVNCGFTIPVWPCGQGSRLWHRGVDICRCTKNSFRAQPDGAWVFRLICNLQQRRAVCSAGRLRSGSTARCRRSSGEDFHGSGRGRMGSFFAVFPV